MDDSYPSSMCKAVLNCKEITPDSDCSEESGWTAYFEDFSAYNNINIINNDDVQIMCSSFDDSPSLVSDAATNGAWRNISLNKHVNIPKSPTKLSFMKKTSREISADDSLEDTASSFVNSPKVYCLSQFSFSIFYQFSLFLSFIYLLSV